MKQFISELIYNFKFSLTKKRVDEFDINLSLNDIKKLKSRNLQYKYFHHFYWNLAPTWLKEHRTYFSQKKRGFGEDAFHAMWYLIFKEFKPRKILEIGVYRGQTISLFSLLSKELNFESEIHGISPFTSAGDKVSIYLQTLDYENDVKYNFDALKLTHPILHKGFSNNKDMIKIIESSEWDLIYIDGNHDYEVAKQDFQICAKHIKNGGLIILDDASLHTDYIPSFYSTAGHPGPSVVASEIDLTQFEEIISVGHNRVFLKK